MKTLQELLEEKILTHDAETVMPIVENWLKQFIIKNACMVHSQHQNEVVQGLIKRVRLNNSKESKQ